MSELKRNRASTGSAESKIEAMIRESDLQEDLANTEVQPASDVTIYNAYSMGPAFGKKFPLPYIVYILNEIMQQKLVNKVYTAEEAAKWTREIADTVNLKFKGRGVFPRFKHVVNVMLYQQTGAGCFYGARAIWDPLSDDFGSYTFDGGSFVCIATVFGCYQY
ncbi:dynein light chain Tctex-type [Drosophila serrata]|uniref:dynein light chain Tctex-type n=1 Tax=Drosophila serrata TaxID=7274 RepID=UPI000A1CF74D|nr:dynein light chain Tctex-type [Drosophila serrata]